MACWTMSIIDPVHGKIILHDHHGETVLARLAVGGLSDEGAIRIPRNPMEKINMKCDLWSKPTAFVVSNLLWPPS